MTRARWCHCVILLVAVAAWTAPRRADAQVAMIATTETGVAASLPLVEANAHVVVDQQQATTTLEQVYANESGMRLEGRFILRAGDGAHVDGFAYYNGDQKIVGEVLEIGDARAIYQSTVRRQRDPGLLEKEGEGAFSFRVFPIQPGERKRVEIKYDQWLARRGGTVEYRLPLTQLRSEIDFELRDDRRVRRVTSPTHALDVSGQGTDRVRVRIGPPRDGARELVLRWQLDDGYFRPTAYVHKDPGEPGYFLFTVAAPRASADSSQDLTIVIDASTGPARAQAAAAAAAIVKDARGSDRLNVVVSGPDPRELYSAPRWLTKDVRAEATAFIADPGDRRQPNLVAGLRAALGAQEDHPRRKTIMLLTEGRADARAAIALARDDRRDVRIYALGLGPNVDKPALSRLTAEKRGRFELVESAEAIPRHVARLSRQLATPVLVDLALSAEGASIDRVYPRTLADLNQEQELTIVGRIHGGDRAKLVLRGRGTEAVALTATIDASRDARRPWVGQSWARQRIEHLLEAMALDGQTPERVTETVDLALTYNVVTPFTAFLAIPASELTADAAGSLALARWRKRAIRSAHPDAVALLAPEETAEAADRAPASAAASPPEPAPTRVDAERVHAHGCAGCRVGSSDADSDAPMGALAASLGVIVALARRGRWRRRGRA